VILHWLCVGWESYTCLHKVKK